MKNEKSHPHTGGSTHAAHAGPNVIATKIILTAQSAEAGRGGGRRRGAEARRKGERVDLNARACPRGTRRGGPTRATTARVNTVRPL
jgi:hypothetical protein